MRLSLAALATEGPIEGYEIDEDIAEDLPVSAVEQVNASVAVNDVVPEQSTLVQSELTFAISVGTPLPQKKSSRSPTVQWFLAT